MFFHQTSSKQFISYYSVCNRSGKNLASPAFFPVPPPPPLGSCGLRFAPPLGNSAPQQQQPKCKRQRAREKRPRPSVPSSPAAIEAVSLALEAHQHFLGPHCKGETRHYTDSSLPKLLSSSWHSALLQKKRRRSPILRGPKPGVEDTTQGEELSMGHRDT